MSLKQLKKLEILHENEDFIAINKPAGILSIADRFHPEIINVHTYLNRSDDDFYTVHRLDRDTSGVLLFAKSKEAHRALSLIFEHREIQKYYLALVDGVPSDPQSIIDAAIIEHPHKKGQYTIHRKGKPSQTSYNVEQTWQRYSLLKLQLHTGRTHQIRVHLDHIGHRLLVDKLYGQREAFYLSEIKGRKYNRSRDEDERPLLHRQPLHAAELIFTWKDQEIKISAPLPKDMRATINQIDKWV